MCDHCNCRRVPQIVDLGAEQERAEGLARSGSPQPAEAV